MGKAEGSAENWHGHVTALTVAPEYRRLGLAAKLMHSLEDVSEKYVKLHYRTRHWLALHKYCAEMAELIGMPFGGYVHLGARDLVLDGVQILFRKEQLAHGPVSVSITSWSSVKTAERMELNFGTIASFHLSYTVLYRNLGISKNKCTSL